MRGEAVGGAEGQVLVDEAPTGRREGVLGRDDEARHRPEGLSSSGHSALAFSTGIRSRSVQSWIPISNSAGFVRKNAATAVRSPFSSSRSSSLPTSARRAGLSGYTASLAI